MLLSDGHCCQMQTTSTSSEAAGDFPGTGRGLDGHEAHAGDACHGLTGGASHGAKQVGLFHDWFSYGKRSGYWQTRQGSADQRVRRRKCVWMSCSQIVAFVVAAVE